MVKNKTVNSVQFCKIALGILLVFSFVIILSCKKNDTQGGEGSKDKNALSDNSYCSILESEYNLYDEAPPNESEMDIKISRGELVKVIDNEQTWPLVRLADGTIGYVEPWGMERTTTFDLFTKRLEPQQEGGAEVIADQARVFYQDLLGKNVDWTSVRAGYYPRGMKLKAIKKLKGGYWQVESGGFNYFIFGSAITACELPVNNNPVKISVRNSGVVKERRRIVLESVGALSVVERKNSFSRNMLAFEIAVTGASGLAFSDLPKVENMKLNIEEKDNERNILFIKTDYPVCGYRVVRDSPGKASIEINTNLWKNHGKSLYGVRVFLDPGHGGDELPGYAYGAKSLEGTVHERDLVLIAARELKKMLEAKEAVVKNYRNTNGDYYRLYDRIDNADAFGADIYIGVHYNQAPIEWTDNEKRSMPRGAQTFFNHPQAEKLAAVIGKRIPNSRNPSSEYGNFGAIRQTNTVAVLIELGFLTNPHELEELTDPAFRNEQLQGVVNGIIEYVASIGG